jgi:hypothetical protein
MGTQNPVLAREWEFDPPSGHQRSTEAHSFAFRGDATVAVFWNEDETEEVSLIKGPTITFSDLLTAPCY